MPTESETLAHDPEIAPLLKTNYWRPHVREELQREVDAIDRKLADPTERRFLANPGRLAQQNAQRKGYLHAQTPPSLTNSQQAKLARLEQASEASIREGMLSNEEMRRRPTGAVDAHMAWERSKKPDILRWKRARLLLNPDSTARDLANIERFRPSTPTARMMTDALIPGIFALTPAAKANYDSIDWGDPAVQERARQELLARGALPRDGYTVKAVRARKLRQPSEAYPTFECQEHERRFTGPAGKAHYTRHIKAHAAVTA